MFVIRGLISKKRPRVKKVSSLPGRMLFALRTLSLKTLSLKIVIESFYNSSGVTLCTERKSMKIPTIEEWWLKMMEKQKWLTTITSFIRENTLSAFMTNFTLLTFCMQMKK